MLAITFHEFGGPEVLCAENLPEPTAKKGEVVIKVAAATVNPTDTLMRAGKQAAMMTEMKPPFIAGMELAGHVHAVGEGVTNVRVGQPVMAIVNPRGPGGGAMAEYVAVPAASCAALAPSVNLVEAATVPMNGLTAKIAMEQLSLPPGASLLVTGGAGALGGYVIQMAKYFGLKVVADGKDSDVELLRGLGADKVVPRGDALAASVRQLYPNGVDGLVDAALLKDSVAPLVRDGGVATAVRFTHLFTDHTRLRATNVAVLTQVTNTFSLVWLAEMLAKGVLTARVAKHFPAAQAADAHRLVEAGGVRGRVVITF